MEKGNIIIFKMTKDDIVEIDGVRYDYKKLRLILLEASKWEDSLKCDSSIDDIDIEDVDFGY